MCAQNTHPLTIPQTKVVFSTMHTLTLEDPHCFPNGKFEWKRYQKCGCDNRYFHLDNAKTVFLFDLLHQLSRSFPKILALKNFLPIFRTPYQMVTRIVEAVSCFCFVSYTTARVKGSFNQTRAHLHSPL